MHTPDCRQRFEDAMAATEDGRRRVRARDVRHGLAEDVEEDAAEALQDAFLSAYRGLAKFKRESRFSTWLYRIATNASLMKLRRRRDGHVSYEQSQGGDGDADKKEEGDDDDDDDNEDYA